MLPLHHGEFLSIEMCLFFLFKAIGDGYCEDCLIELLKQIYYFLIKICKFCFPSYVYLRRKMHNLF